VHHSTKWHTNSQIEIDKKKDKYDLWALLKKSARIYNLQILRNEWTNFTQWKISCRVINTQRISQHLPGPPRFSQQQSLGIYWLRKSKYPTCWSILSSISSGYIQLWFITPSFNDVKSHFMYLDQLNHTNSTTHPSMNNGTATINKLNVDTPVISPTPPLVQNCNSTILTLQPSQCAMCGQSSQHIPKDAHNV